MDAQYRNAIGTVESSNNYGAVGPETDSGDRAYGRYQVMGANIPSWTEKHLGRSMTPQEFLKDQDAQDRVFDGETSNSFKKYGNLDDVTSTWFSGRPMAKAGDASDGYNTTPQYIAKVNAAYNGNPIQTAMRGKNAMASTDDTPPALSSTPGPGALSANGKGDWLSNIGDTLMNMAPGLASISSPQQAAALATLAAASKKTGGTWTTGAVDPKTGVAVQTNSLSGQTRNLQVHSPQPDERKWGIVTKDKYGQPVYGYPPSQEDFDAGKTSNAAAPSDDSDAVSLTGQPFMDQVTKDKGAKYASQVQSIIEGRTPYPTGMLLKTPYGQQLAQDVTQADPSFESGDAMSRVKVRNEFKAGGNGAPAGQILAGNTALQHAGEMSDALEKFKGNGADYTGIPFASYYANQLHNAAIQGTGTPESQAYNDFMTAKNHFSEEVTKFYSGTAGSEAERKRALANLDEAKSLPELRSAIKEESALMQGKVNALQKRWRTGMGPLVKDFPLIDPNSQDAMDRIGKRYETSSGATAAPAAPTNTSTPSRKTATGVPWSFN